MERIWLRGSIRSAESRLALAGALLILFLGGVPFAILEASQGR